VATVAFRMVCKSFGEVGVLRDISFEIADGEFVVVVGPSGCGKSTLLRMVAGLESITEGTIEIDGREVNRVPARDRDIAMVFQSYALYPHMTVRQNIGFGMELRKVAKGEIEARVARAAGVLDLGTLLDRLPRELSGGQRQRVAMGRAIVRDPKVFLFDEPLSNLDAKLRASMRAEIKELQQRLGTTTVYVTHDQVEAMTMADRIVVLQHGLIEQIGDPLELYDRPRNAFVAQFIGWPTMNLVRGVYEGKRQGVRWGREAEHFLPTLPLRAEDGQAVMAGVRAEDLRLATADEADGFEARIGVVQRTGMDTELVVDVSGERLTFLDRHRTAVSPGDRVRLAAAPSKIHVFDRATGNRLPLC
jgi:multiple sugar transport system ATP-binding protein